MSVGRTIITLLVGIAGGLTLAYYADPKASQKTLKRLEKDLKDSRKDIDKKLQEVKSTYNTMLDKYANSSKELLSNVKGFVENGKKTAKAK